MGFSRRFFVRLKVLAGNDLLLSTLFFAAFIGLGLISAVLGNLAIGIPLVSLSLFSFAAIGRSLAAYDEVNVRFGVLWLQSARRSDLSDLKVQDDPEYPGQLYVATADGGRVWEPAGPSSWFGLNNWQDARADAAEEGRFVLNSLAVDAPDA